MAERGKTLISPVVAAPCNNFNTGSLQLHEIRIPAAEDNIRVIRAFEGQLITEMFITRPLVLNNHVVSDPGRDLLKLVVKNRYHQAPVAVGFINNIGLKRGALASCVAHDSHNIVAVGVDDADIVEAVNMIVSSGGGISLVDEEMKLLLPLPFAGIMSGNDGFEVAQSYEAMDRQAHLMGSTLSAPFMTLSFMALLVIPELKLSDKGLFDGSRFEFTELFQK